MNILYLKSNKTLKNKAIATFLNITITITYPCLSWLELKKQRNKKKKKHYPSKKKLEEKK